MINFGPHNTNKNYSNFAQVVPAYTSNSSQFTYCAQRWDADAEYLGRVWMALHSHVGSINFADPANIRQVHDALMREVRKEAIYVSNKYKIQKNLYNLDGTSSFQP